MIFQELSFYCNFTPIPNKLMSFQAICINIVLKYLEKHVG
jgi:hypothetical protein